MEAFAKSVSINPGVLFVVCCLGSHTRLTCGFPPRYFTSPVGYNHGPVADLPVKCQTHVTKAVNTASVSHINYRDK